VSSGTLPYLALALGILSLGFSGILVRWAQAPGIITSFYRMLLAGVLLGIPFLRQARAAGGLSRRGIWVAALGGAFFAADVATWSTGVMLGGATNPTLLANVAPVWVALAAVLLLKERLAGRFWLGLALAFAGAGLVLRVDLTRGAAFGHGSALGLLASVFYGATCSSPSSAGGIWIRSATPGLPGPVRRWSCLGGLAFRLPFTGYPPSSYWNFLGLVGSQVLGYLAVTYALGRLPARW
jgi:drug/metabolite transporter (DMT)-like permease